IDESETSKGRSSLPRTFIRLNDLSGLGTGAVECGSTHGGGESLPYPTLAPVVFFYLKQTTRPRSWCLKMVCNPYPFFCFKFRTKDPSLLSRTCGR
uniref:Uncharacterized protein n=1 Tax=Poecilia latipinna TaxID=48699 RepID=A0A3B3UXF7_9TELE